MINRIDLELEDADIRDEEDVLEEVAEKYEGLDCPKECDECE